MSTFRSAVRSLYRSVPLSLAAVACVALGSAATAAVVTLVGAALLRPLPFPAADRLVRLWFAEADGNPRVSLSIPDLRDAEKLSCFDVFLGTARVRVAARFESGAQRMRGEAVSPAYFETLALRSAIGRTLTP